MTQPNTTSESPAPPPGSTSLLPAEATRRLIGAVRLVHPFPVAIVVVTFVGLALIASDHGIHPVELARVALVVLLTQIPVGALNDYVDRFADAQTQPSKPLPAGLATPRTALSLTVVSLIALIPAALTFGWVSLLVILIGTGAGLAYDLWLKPTPVSFAAYLVGFLALFTWVWMVMGRLTPWFPVVYPAGALLLVAAHLAQSFPDIETDRELGHRGLATVLGPEWTFRLILLFVGTVGSGGVVLAALSRSYPGLALAGAGLAAALLSACLYRETIVSREARVRMFRLIAPAIGVLALGCVLALRAMT